MWFFLGILLGVLGLIILYFLPDLNTARHTNNDNPETSPDKPMVELLPAPPKIAQPDQEEWYYLDRKNNQQGPVSLAIVKQEWAKGEIDQDTYVWCQEFDQWYKIKDLKDVMDNMD